MDSYNTLIKLTEKYEKTIEKKGDLVKENKILRTAYRSLLEKKLEDLNFKEISLEMNKALKKINRSRVGVNNLYFSVDDIYYYNGYYNYIMNYTSNGYEFVTNVDIEDIERLVNNFYNLLDALNKLIDSYIKEVNTNINKFEEKNQFLSKKILNLAKEQEDSKSVTDLLKLNSDLFLHWTGEEWELLTNEEIVQGTLARKFEIDNPDEFSF